MPTNELFIVEYADGEIDDSGDYGSFTVYPDRASAQEMLDCLEDQDATVVRFVREDASVVQAGRIEELERMANWARTEAQQDDIASGDWRDGLARLCLNRAAAIRAAMPKGPEPEPEPKAYIGWMAPAEDPGKG